MFKPILTDRDLPGLGSHEHHTLDFKVQPATGRFQMAKDVAAFSNAAGGTTLIGAAMSKAPSAPSSAVLGLGRRRSAPV